MGTVVANQQSAALVPNASAIDSELQRILEAFSTYDGVYKRAEMQRAVDLQEAITPHLISLLEGVLSDPQPVTENADAMGHTYALYLLGHFREQRAHFVIVQLASLPGELPSDLFGDSITEDLDILLYRTSGGDLEEIEKLAANADANQYCRSAAVKALSYALIDDAIGRDDIVAFFRGLFANIGDEPYSFFWTSLSTTICNIYPEELMDRIRYLYESELIETFFIDYGSFEETLHQGKEATLARLKKDFERADRTNIHDWMSWWASFKSPKTSPGS